MNLLVLAQTPPPIHGQSVMVRALVEGLAEPGLAVTHVNLSLSRDLADVGRWRIGKFFGVLSAVVRTLAARFRKGCDTLYYVPAPAGKRGALYRDWVIMALCRPWFRRLVLHIHAPGLGAWLATEASAVERGISHLLLGRAELMIVLSSAFHEDAMRFRPHRTATVANGIPDPGPPVAPPTRGPMRVVFLGLGSETKGLFAAAAGVLEANRRNGAAADAPAFVLTAAGGFDDPTEAARFRALTATHPATLHHAGFLAKEQRRELLARAHVLCLPTCYPAEGMPLVVIEALAADRAVVATRWRALPEMLAQTPCVLLSDRDPATIASALEALRCAPPPPGVCRSHFLARFTIGAHLDALRNALRPAAHET